MHLLTPSSSRPRGFTLIELLTALAIAAILLGLAAPYLRDFAVRSTLSGISNEFTGSVLRARNEAVSKNICIAMCIVAADSTDLAPKCEGTATDWQKGWMVFLNPGCDATNLKPAPADRLLMRSAVDAAYSMKSNSGKVNYLQFNGRGMPRAADVDRFDLSYQNDLYAYNRSLCLGTLGRTVIIKYQDGCP